MIRPARLAALAAIFPALATAQESKTHTVVRGNTLWAIAGQYVGDPFQWPRIHEANSGLIANPHRILPGWEVLIPGAASASAATAPGAQPGPSAPGPVGTAATEGAPPPSSGSAYVPFEPGEQTPPSQVPPRTVFYRERPLEAGGPDAPAPMWDVPPEQFYAAPWLIPPGSVPESSGEVESLVGESDVISPRTTARVYDRVHVRMGGVLPAAGSRLQVMRVTRTVQEVGQVVQPTGVLLVEESTPAGVVAVVESQFDRIALGDVVRPLPPFTPAPAGSTLPATDGAEATVLEYATDRAVQTLGDYAFIDAGAAGGVRVGDEYLVVPESPDVQGQSGARLKVVAVLQEVATARIVALEDPVFPTGVRLRPDRRVR
jgi:hypothetical protein